MSLDQVRDVTAFRPGKSGNPRGPIKSLIPARRALARHIADNSTALVDVTMRLALAGDGACAAALVTLLASGFEAPAAGKNAAAGPGARSAVPVVMGGE